MKYKDFSMNITKSGNNEEYSGTNAFILSIKNILLSRQGNFPFTPKLAVDIEKYQFAQLDDYTLSDIKTELLHQINEYNPTADNVDLTINKVEDMIDGKMVYGIGISVSAIVDGEKVLSNFLVVKNNNTINVFNETGNK